MNVKFSNLSYCALDIRWYIACVPCAGCSFKPLIKRSKSRRCTLVTAKTPSAPIHRSTISLLISIAISLTFSSSESGCGATYGSGVTSCVKAFSDNSKDVELLSDNSRFPVAELLPDSSRFAVADVELFPDFSRFPVSMVFSV
ncbi:hypothetical protein D3C85_1376900 [compost metagenome]